jgi:predicted transcriptional regulator
MRIKKIKIKTRDEFFDEAMKVAKALDRGERPKPSRKEEYFESLEAARNVLTEKRLELWRLIRDRHPRSLSELAKMAGRDFKSIHRDVGVLVSVGLVELKKSKGQRGDTQVPSSLADALTLEVA